jgi:hypothetical protein
MCGINKPLEAPPPPYWQLNARGTASALSSFPAPSAAPPVPTISTTASVFSNQLVAQFNGGSMVQFQPAAAHLGLFAHPTTSSMFG